MQVLSKVRDLASLVRLSHTIFGLPFALAAATLAYGRATAAGEAHATGWRLLLVIVAFTAARTAAMAFNRLVDRDVDAMNPRTRDREIPRGAVSVQAAAALTALCAATFLGTAWLLGPWPGRLALPCLLLVLGYSYFKRFSWASHLALGLALALAPGGAYLAIRGGFDGWPAAALLMGAVATWVAGFDVLYALQDEAFDRGAGLHSIPARFGVTSALMISALLHMVTVACLLALHVLVGLGPYHLVGIVLVAGILIWEHSIVRPSDLSRIGRAFFDLNGYVSLGYLACMLLDQLA
jgi:4-hydroxybenzoate polyprenyltransferase